MEHESQEFQMAMAFFVNHGMVHTKPIKIDSDVVDAIGEGMATVPEPVEYPARVTGKLLMSIPGTFDVANIEELAKLEFLKIAFSKCDPGEDGDALREAINAAIGGDEDMMATVEGLLELMLVQAASSDDAPDDEQAGSSTDAPSAPDDVLTVQDLKNHATELAKASSRVTVSYVAPRDVSGEEQLQTTWMTFAENGMIVGDKNLPVPRSVGMLRPSAYSVADEILQRLPLFNTPLFCPSACVVLTQDMHRVAASTFSLLREAVFMWVVHAVVYLEVDPDPKKTADHGSKNYAGYVAQVVAITKFMQPYAETFKEAFKALEGGFEANTEAFYQKVAEFTGNILFLAWRSVLHLFGFPEATYEALQLGGAYASRAHFTKRELEENQKHQDGIMAERKPEGAEDDERLVSVVYPHLFPLHQEDEVPTAPKLQDGIDPFIAHMVAVNRAVPTAHPDMTMGQLRDLWGYCENLCALDEPIWPSALSDVMGLLGEPTCESPK